jgi:nucleotide-binding universal stress UspA family protein
MFNEVLVPFNESELSERTIAIATDLTRSVGGSMRLLVGSSDDRIGQLDLAQRVADSISIRTGLRVTITAMVTQGFLHDELVEEAAASANAVLCIPATQGGRRAAITGSMSMDVLTHLDQPVVLVGPRCEPAPLLRDGPVVVALDGSDEAERILATASDWAHTFNRPLDLMTVLDPATPDLVAAAAGDLQESAYVANLARAAVAAPGDDPMYEVRHGDAAPEIIDTAVARNAPMIAMTSHVPHGFDRLLHGSVLDDVVAKSPVPVLAIHRDENPGN